MSMTDKYLNDISIALTETGRIKSRPQLTPVKSHGWARILGLIVVTLLALPTLFLLVIWPLSPILSELLIALRGGF